MSYIVRKRLYLLIIIFVLNSIVNFLFDYIFRPSDIDILRNISVALGISIGVTFGDKVFLYLINRKKKKF